MDQYNRTAATRAWMARAGMCELLSRSFAFIEAEVVEAYESGDWRTAAEELSGLLGAELPPPRWYEGPEAAGAAEARGALPGGSAEAAYRSFVDGHPKAWMERFADAVLESTTAGFYRSAARLLKSALARL